MMMMLLFLMSIDFGQVMAMGQTTQTHGILRYITSYFEFFNNMSKQIDEKHDDDHNETEYNYEYDDVNNDDIVNNPNPVVVLFLPLVTVLCAPIALLYGVSVWCSLMSCLIFIGILDLIYLILFGVEEFFFALLLRGYAQNSG